MDILGIFCIMFAAGADPEEALADMFDRPEAVSFGVGVFSLPTRFRCRFLDDFFPRNPKRRMLDLRI